VVAEEFEEALAAIKFGTEEERGWRRQLASGKRRLLWLTLWDWDAQGEDDTDTIQMKRRIHAKHQAFGVTPAHPRSRADFGLYPDRRSANHRWDHRGVDP
jgi:hypothetical protein